MTNQHIAYALGLFMGAMMMLFTSVLFAAVDSVVLYFLFGVPAISIIVFGGFYLANRLTD